MQKIIHNHPVLKERRKGLRNNMTPEEVILWNYLRSSRLGYKFRRQVSIGPYIVDFYCPTAKVIVELDGLQHLSAKEYDTDRDGFLQALGYIVLRFWNQEITTNITTVIEKIRQAISTPSAFGHSPYK